MSGNNTEQIAELETCNPGLFRDLLKAAAIINEEHDIRLAPDGIRFTTMDPSHVAMIDMFIPDMFFDLYEVPEDKLICLNVREILRLVFNRKSGKLKDSTLKIRIEDAKIHFAGSGKLQGSKSHFTLEPMEEEVPQPKINFRARVRLLTKTLKQIIGDCDLHPQALITFEPDKVLFQNADGEGRLAENQLDRYADPILDFESEGLQAAAYTVEYLAAFMRAIKPLSDVTTLELSDDMPMRVTAEMGHDIRLVYYVAPYTDTDGIRELIEPKAKEPQVEEPPVIEAQVEEVPAIEAPVEEVDPIEDLDLTPEEKEALEVMIENYNEHVLGREDRLTPEERERLMNIDIIDEVFPEEKPPTAEETLIIGSYEDRCAAASAAVDEVYRQFAEGS